MIRKTSFARALVVEAVCVSLLFAPGAAWSQYGTGGYPPTTKAAAGAAPGAAAPGAAAPRTPAPGAATTAPAADGKQPFKQEELDQIVAPIALYPDPLLSQVFMASTYPLEVVEADRWVKANKTLKGNALTAELEKKKWDPSVKSLVNFPDVLAMMSEKLDWMVKLGDAFLGQQAQVMDAVQQLRTKAQATGNLKTNEQQKVIVEPASTTAPAGTASTQIIKIEPASPEVIYVPTYNPTVVYGTWPYPSYPPSYYYPPGYVAGAAAISFGVGLAVGAAWGYAWGGCSWGHGHSHVDIDVDRNTTINNNINRNNYKGEINRNNVNAGDRAGATGASQWKHDPSHRQGVSYRDNATARQYKGAQGAASPAAAQTREAYRGRADAGRADIARGGASNYQPGSQNRPGGSGAGTGGPSGAQNRAGSAGTANRAGSSGANRSSSSGGSAFSGAGSSGSAARASSQRGQSSRSSSSGGARSGGGGGRGGGGGGRR